MTYEHGGDIYSQRIQWDFSVNLNPLGMPERVKEAVRRSADFCACYPDSLCRELVKKLSGYHSVLEEDILCGNGAADLIYQIAFADPLKEGWVLAPGFSEYERALVAASARVHPFYLKREENFSLDIDGLIRALKEEKVGEGRALFLSNPNNPTGRVVSGKEIRRLAGFAEEMGIRLVLDECFLDFWEGEEEDSLIPHLKGFPHAVVLRAFTKRYAMAGLRLGYCITRDPLLLDRMARHRQPWTVSVPAQAAGEAALDEEEYRRKSDRVIREGRRQLKDGLEKLGFWVCDSQANFLLFQDLRREGRDGRLFFRCRDRGLLLRHCDNFHGLDKSYYRVCVKGEEENALLLDMLKELTAG